MTFLCIALGKEVDQAIKEGNKALLGTLKELSLKKRNRLQFLNYVWRKYSLGMFTSCQWQL